MVNLVNDNIIVVKILGGLGNQLFQYMVYRTLLEQGKNVFCDLSWHENENNKYWYPYQLDLLNLKKQEIKRMNYRLLDMEYPNKSEMPNDLLPYLTIYREKERYEFDEKVFNANNVSLLGYWQNPQYFLNLQSKILQEVQFLIKGKNLNEYEKHIVRRNSVSVHIRRNDYAHEEFDDICTIKYYNDAIQYIKSHVENPCFYIFSNNMRWAKENIESDNMIFVEENDRFNGLGDLKLISLCKHNIIANSTFSWWGAWLNKNANNIVIAPKEWSKNRNANNIYINDWIRI